MVQPRGTRQCCCGCVLNISEICFRVVCIMDYPNLEAECENAIRVSAIVTHVYYGSIVNVGDEIIIYDPRHTHFNISIESLIGSTGTAVYYHMPVESDWGEIVFPCPEYDLLGGCRWVVTSMDSCENVTKDEIVFRVLSNAPVVRTTVGGLEEIDYGLRVLAEVIEIPCNITDISIWDRIIVWDVDFDKFDLPIQVLLGAIGTARWQADPLKLEDPYCIEYTDKCRWIATGIICNEDLYLCD